MLPCLLLVLVLLIAITSKVTTSFGLIWPILIGGFVVLHIWMMFKGHGTSDTSNHSTGDKISTVAEKEQTRVEHTHNGNSH